MTLSYGCPAMKLLPIELYLGLILVIPLGVCFAKWRFEASWTAALLACAGMSWLYFNLWMMVLDPPDNRLANYVFLISGWVWLLPVFGLFVGVFCLFELRLSLPTMTKVGKSGFLVCVGVMILIVLWNLFGRMSSERAIVEARKELIERGYEPSGRELPVYLEGHWIVRYPDTQFGEIRLHRNGRMSWIGGPG